MKELPLGRHLTHLGSGLPLTSEHEEYLRLAGVRGVPAWPPFWMHRLTPDAFRR